MLRLRHSDRMSEGGGSCPPFKTHTESGEMSLGTSFLFCTRARRSLETSDKASHSVRLQTGLVAPPLQLWFLGPSVLADNGSGDVWYGGQPH